MPVIISPTGVQAVHPDGEVAVARAAAARGTAVGLSSFGSKPIEEVVAANPQTFFQMYWMGDRDTMVRRMDRARDAGAVGLIATLDWSFSHGRDWGSPSIPDKIDLRTMARFAPEVARRPRWLLDFARTRRLPDLSVPNVVGRGETPPTFFGAYGEWMGTPPPSWKDVAWLREEWGGPFMVKGISGSTTRSPPATPASPRCRCPTTAATTSTAPRRRSACCPRSPRPSATTSRS